MEIYLKDQKNREEQKQIYNRQPYCIRPDSFEKNTKLVTLKNTEWRRQRRKDTSSRQAEQTLDTTARRKRRSNPEQRLLEQTQNTKLRKENRENTKVRNVEQLKDTQQKRQKREDPQAKHAEENLKIHNSENRNEKIHK